MVGATIIDSASHTHPLVQASKNKTKQNKTPAPSQITPAVEHLRPEYSDEHIGSKKLKLSEPGSLPSGAPIGADVNLRSDDMRVECLMERFERE